MAVAKRGVLFYACRGVLRLKNLGWRTEVEQFPEPCVYICSHSNMAGPLTTLAQLPQDPFQEFLTHPVVRPGIMIPVHGAEAAVIVAAVHGLYLNGIGPHVRPVFRRKQSRKQDLVISVYPSLMILFDISIRRVTSDDFDQSHPFLTVRRNARRTGNRP